MYVSTEGRINVVQYLFSDFSFRIAVSNWYAFTNFFFSELCEVIVFKLSIWASAPNRVQSCNSPFHVNLIVKKVPLFLLLQHQVGVELKT